MKINWIKACIAGIIGTVAFDIIGWLFTGTWWDLPHVLAKAVGVPFPVGLGMHFGNGIALAVVYGTLAPSLVGPSWFRAVFFTTLETVILFWFLVFPLLGFGVAGLGGGLILPILSMIRHWAYAMPLAYYFRAEEPSSRSNLDTAQIIQS